MTDEYCPVQISVGMPKNPYPLSLANSSVRIIRIRSNQEVPDYFAELSEKSTDEHLPLSSVSGIFMVMMYIVVFMQGRTIPNTKAALKHPGSIIRSKGLRKRT